MLRDGVKLIRGHKRNGSDYYLVDDDLFREYHIDTKFAGYLMGLNKKTDRKEAYDQFLVQNKLTGTDIAVKPKQPLSARLLSWSIDLFNPATVLNKTKKYWNWLFGSAGIISLAVSWCVVLWLMRGSGNEFIGYIDQYHTATVHILVGLVLTKLFHELGHSAALIKNGAQARSIGVVFIALFPLPKTLAYRTCVLTPGQKLQVALAGIYIEAWIAAICAFLWIGIQDSSLRVTLHFLAVISFGMTATLNLLPLMKFDGYQALSAVLDAPKLYENAVSVFRAKIYRFLGKRATGAYISTRISQKWLLLYGAAIFAWRITLPVAIAAGSITMLGRPGHFMATLAIFVMLIKPGVSEAKKIMAAENKGDSMIKKIMLLSIILLFLTWLIVPMNHTKAYKGVIELEKQIIAAPIDAVLLNQRKSGQVNKGDRLVHLARRDIAVTRNELYTQSAMVSQNALERQHLNNLAMAEQEQAETIKKQLSLTSISSGYWSPEPFEPLLKAGDKLGILYSEKATVKAFLPAHQFGDEKYQVLIKIPGKFGLRKVTLTKFSEAINPNVLPEWFKLGYSNYLVYESDYDNAGMEMPVDVYVERKFSITKEFFYNLRTFYLN